MIAIWLSGHVWVGGREIVRQDVPLVTVLFLHITALCSLLCTGYCFHPVTWQGEFNITKVT